MKICNIVPFLAPHFGGVVDRCFHITKELIKMGHSVTLCTSDYQFDDGYAGKMGNIDLHVFKSYFGRFCITPGLKNFLELNADQYDVFHLMNNYSYVNVVASEICYRKKIPYIYSAMGSLPVMSRSFFRKHLFNKLIGKKIVRRAARLCAITEQEVNQYLSYDHKINRDNIVKLPNAIEDSYDERISCNLFRQHYDIPLDSFLILFVGRLEYVKGVDLLIKAFAQLYKNHAQLYLAIVGPDFGEQDKLVFLIEKYGLKDRIIMTGPLYGEDKSAAYAGSNILVVPSRWENMSIVALEAASWKLPVVITDTSGFPEIETEQSGLVVDSSVTGIAEGIEKILANPAEYGNMRVNARQMVKKFYLWNVVGIQLENMLESIRVKD